MPLEHEDHEAQLPIMDGPAADQELLTLPHPNGPRIFAARQILTRRETNLLRKIPAFAELIEHLIGDACTKGQVNLQLKADHTPTRVMDGKFTMHALTVKMSIHVNIKKRKKRADAGANK